MREQLRERIQPLTDELADALTDIVVARVELVLRQVREAIDVGLSSANSDLDVDLAAPEPRALSLPKFRSVDEKSRAKIVGLTDFVPKTKVKPAKKGERTNTCSKCGAVGFTARTCGKTHNVSTPPAKEEDDDEEEATTPPPSPAAHRPARSPAASPKPATRAPTVDRFALIEARAEKRRELESGRSSRGRDAGMEPGDGSEGGVVGPVRIDPEPEVEVSVASRSTFVIDPM